MAQNQKTQEEDEQPTITVGTSSSGYQKFPLRPTFWDRTKEAFQPTDVRAQIDAIRKRRTGDT